MSTPYAHVFQAVLERPWAIQPHYLRAIVEVLERRIAGERLSDEEILERIGSPQPPAERAYMVDPVTFAAVAEGSEQPGALQILPLVGVLSQRAGMIGMSSSPGTSVDQFGRRFQAAVDDPRIGAIVIDVDSPGGEVYGTPELGERIRAARGKKPIVAVANSLSASAAYWLAAQADELVVTPGGEVGSIGVWAAHTEFSEMDAAAGVKTTIVRAGEFKYELNEYEPLSDEAKAHLQERIDDYYAMFLTAVAKGRGVPVSKVRGEYGKGRVLGAHEAVRLGMADRVDTLDNTLRRVAARTRAPAGATVSDDGVTKLEYVVTAGALADASWTDTGPAAGAIAPHKSSAIAADDAEWDGPGEVAKCPAEREPLRRMHAWVDDDGDPDAKSSYKLPHHRADGTLVPRGVSAAAQRLGQADIPEDDKAGVRSHLGGHYGEMDKTPPWEEEGESAAVAAGVEVEIRRRRLRR